MERRASGPSHQDGAHQYGLNIHVRRVNGEKLVWQMGRVNYIETFQEADWSVVTDENAWSPFKIYYGINRIKIVRQ